MDVSIDESLDCNASVTADISLPLPCSINSDEQFCHNEDEVLLQHRLWRVYSREFTMWRCDWRRAITVHRTRKHVCTFHQGRWYFFRHFHWCRVPSGGSDFETIPEESFFVSWWSIPHPRAQRKSQFPTSQNSQLSINTSFLYIVLKQVFCSCGMCSWKHWT